MLEVDKKVELNSMKSDDATSIMDKSLKFQVLAGTVAGLTEHTLIYPLDMLRTRFQCAYSLKNAPKLKNLAYDIYRTQGPLGFFKGVSIIAYGAGPAHAFYFGIYEYFKQLEEKNGKRTTWMLALSSFLSTLSHDIIMVPTDSIKQRFQLIDCPYKSLRSCAYCEIKNSGISSLYKSFFIQLSMNVPFHFTNFYTYELTNRLLRTNNDYNPVIHSVCGILSGIAGSCITNPMDICKTYLNVQKMQTKSSISNPIEAFIKLRQKIGFRGFFAGTTIRALQVAPSTMASWSVYEFAKYIFKSTYNYD